MIHKYYYIIFLIFIHTVLSHSKSEEYHVKGYKIKNLEIVSPLENKVGDKSRGKLIISGRKANCLACHQVPFIDEKFQGNFGPDLKNLGNRMSEGEIRLRLVNSKHLYEDSIMPAYYDIKNLKRVAKQYKNKTILSAQEIEDVISWLITLKD